MSSDRECDADDNNLTIIHANREQTQKIYGIIDELGRELSLVSPEDKLSIQVVITFSESYKVGLITRPGMPAHLVEGILKDALRAVELIRAEEEQAVH